MSDMDKLLAARFFVDEGTALRSVDVRVGAGGKLIANSSLRSKVARLQIYRADASDKVIEPVFWTHCCASESRFALGERTLVVEYVVRNALFDGINCGSSVDKIGPMLFRLEAELGSDRKLSIKALRFGKFSEGASKLLYEIWNATPPQNDFRWPLKEGIKNSRFLFFGGMIPGAVGLSDNGGKTVPFKVRLVKKSGEDRSRVEFELGLNHATKLSASWPSWVADGASEPLVGPRLRFRQGQSAAAALEFGIPLDHDINQAAQTYKLVQTDPWTPPLEGDDTVWREFHIRDFPADRVLNGFNRCVSDPVRTAANLSNEADGISLLPVLESTASGSVRANIHWRQQDLRPREAKWRGAEDFGPMRGIGISTTGEFQVEGIFPGLASSQNALRVKTKCIFSEPTGSKGRADDYCSVVTLSEAEVSEPCAIEAGAMRLDFSGASLKKLSMPWGLTTDRYRPGVQRPVFLLECEFSKVDVQPVGFDPDPVSRFSDDANSDLLQTPIVYAVDQSAAIRSVFSATERLRDDHSRSLELTLAAQSPDRAAAAQQQKEPSVELIVLDPTPFFIAKIEFRLPIANDDAGNTYATWKLSDPEGPRWRFKSLQPEMKLTLPTQGVGEAYERRKDIPDPPAGGIDYRLGPHAVFHLRLRDDERAYSDLPWNLRLLFGRPGEAAVGPQMTSARFELLYGLESTLRPAGVHLATDETQRGRIPQSFLGERDSAPDQAKWNRLVAGYQSRLLPLQPYRPLEAGPLCFDEDSGLRQRLRLAKASASDASPDDDPRRECADLHAQPHLEKVDAGNDTGLRGGATFGFESRRIYEAVTRDLQSTSGEMSRVAWTALGGYGALKARFDEDRSIIEASVEQGRVSHYAVERIGRIGVFWNRAKHVIVYERTTERADRYASGDEQQSELAHLPIVRKIDEYIEILEPERRFAPAGRPAQATGFVQGLKFADRIIRVSSLWGRDVGEVGWSVPLWRRDALAKTFPKPLVNLIAASEEAGEDALHAIADPEHLVFFTNTLRDAGSDTDRWPAVEGVDFVDASLRVGSTEAAFGDRSAATLSKPLPAPAEAPASLAICTWRIEDGERSIDLIAGRGSQPVSAKLRNLTVMRKPAGLVGEPSPSRIFAVLLAEAESIRLDLRETLLRGLREFWDEKRWLLERSRILGRIEQFKNSEQLESLKKLKEKTSCDLLVEQAYRPIDALSRDVKSRIKDESEKIRKRIIDLGDNAQAQLENLAEDFRGRIDVLVDNKDLVLENIEGAIRRMEADIDHARLALHTILGEAVTALHEALDKAGQTIDLEAYRTRIAHARHCVESIRRKSEQALEDLSRAIETLSRYWKGREGSDLPSEMRQIAGQADQRMKRLLGDVDARLVQAQKVTEKLEAELNNLQQNFRDAITEAETEVQSHINALNQAAKDSLNAVRSHINGLSAEIDHGLKALRKGVSRIYDDLQEAAKISTDVFLAVLDAGTQRLSLDTDTIFNAAKLAIDRRIRNDICPYLPSLTLGSDFDALRRFIEVLKLLVDELNPSKLSSIKVVLERDWEAWSKLLDKVSDGLRHAVDSLGETVRTAVDAPLSLLRAFGAAPALPSLSFNREWLEYVFDPSDLTIDISPVTSFFAELGDDLKGLSLNLPSIGIDASGLLPAALRDFDLNAVFGSLGGVKMPGLLSRVKLPNLDRNAVRVTHGFDKKTKRAWVQADVDVPYGTNPALFEAMSLALRLVKPRFTARSRMEAGLEGKPAFYAKGEIASTIRIEFSGNPLVDLRDATIRFDDRGQFDFDFSPDRIDFKAGLKFLTDLIRARSKLEQDPEQARGFVPALIEADGVPIGVRTTLELDPGPLNFGAFSIDGLALNLSFELVAKPEFKVGTRISLASPDKPFVLSVGLLGGGGWLAASASYLPSKGLIESEVDIAIAAGRVFSVNFGPIRGMAQVVFGINAKFVSRGSRSRLSLIVFFLFSGDFRLWGIVTVGVYLRLEIEYQSTGSLVGRGVVHVTVKIGRFFKRTVRQRVNYRFAGNSNNRAALTGQGRAVAPAAMMVAGATSQPTVNYPDRAAAYLARYED